MLHGPVLMANPVLIKVINIYMCVAIIYYLLQIASAHSRGRPCRKRAGVVASYLYADTPCLPQSGALTPVFHRFMMVIALELSMATNPPASQSKWTD